jgi:hypothetical protein
MCARRSLRTKLPCCCCWLDAAAASHEKYKTKQLDKLVDVVQKGSSAFAVAADVLLQATATCVLFWCGLYPQISLQTHIFVAAKVLMTCHVERLSHQGVCCLCASCAVPTT